MLLFLDTEFTSLTQHTQLLSLAIVDENERVFYAEFTEVKDFPSKDYYTIFLNSTYFTNYI